MDSGLKLGTIITISVNGIWAGSGNLVEGRITGCGCVFGNSQDESEVIYELIEDAIAEECKVLIDGDDRYTWSIE